jgi:hypothetical protein
MAIAMRHMSRIWRTRSLFARRACIVACIAGTLGSGTPFDAMSSANEGSSLVMPPAVVHAVAEEASSGSDILQVVGKQPEPRRSSNAKALIKPSSAGSPTSSGMLSRQAQPSTTAQPTAPRQSAPSADSFVTPAGGIGNWFGGQTKKAKKEHEDGRKATALPPPDPSTVDWSGVPYHQPKGAANKEASLANEPIRDVQRGSEVPSSTANLRRSGDSTTTPGRSVSATRPTNSSLPSPPIERELPMASTTGSGLKPLPSNTAKSESQLSSNSSTRRSGRRAFEAADLAPSDSATEDVASVPTESAALTEVLPAPSVPRRELMPLETTAKVSPKPSKTTVDESIPQLPPADEVASDIPAVPTTSKTKSSLEESWSTVGSGVRPSVPATSVSTKSKETAPAPQATDEATDELASAEPAEEPKLPSLAAPAATTAPATPTLSQSAAPETTPMIVPPAPAPKPTTTATAPPTAPDAGVVADAKAAGPSPASERALREQLTRDMASTARKPEASGKLLGSSESPGVRVVTEGPSEIMIRELTQYEVRVENRGSFDATGIVVRSSLPPWAQIQGHNASIGAIKTIDQSGQAQLQWTIDKLPAGVVERLFIRVKAVKAGSFDVVTDWTLMPQKHVAKVNVREPKLAIVIDGPEEIVYGRSEKYRVRVMNPGDGDASNVVFTLSPESKSPQSQKIGSIPAGKEAQFEIELTARELGELKIGGVAVADREVKSEANKSIRIAAANVEAELTGPPLKYQNSEAIYHLIVTNTGKAVCESLNAELRLPMGVKYVSGIDQATVKGDLLTWKIDALQPGAIREYDLTCKMDRTGEMVISFNCNGTAAGRASVSINTLVEAIADLVLSISDPAAPAPVNTDVIYEMTIANRGSKAAEDVRVVAQFSHGIEPIRVEGHTGEVLTGQALFNPIARIEPGTTVRLKVTAKADRAGDHRFRAEVRHGETSLMSEEATVFMNAPAERISRRSTDR